MASDMTKTSAGRATFANMPPDTLKVLQLTDMHLYQDPASALLGLNTLQSFQDCIALARRQHWPPDVVLATGDLVHDASPEGYQQLNKIFASLGAPICAIPGNHDIPAVLHKYLIGAHIESNGHFIKKQWQIITLDSSLPNSDAGKLSNTQLEHLDSCLSKRSEHALVCLHHPPIDVGSQWMDTMKLRNPDAFFDVLDRHHQVRIVLWGHIHQEYRADRRGVQLIASPSTCIQFKPGSDDFALDAKAPGYRWLALHADGEFDTGVCRLETIPAGLDINSGGY
jgi:Icc protein